MNKQEELQRMIDESKNIVFFGGAGVSTESNIPDFRSADGLYQEKYMYPPEQVVSHTFFVQKPGMFYEFYKDKMMFLDAKPNKAHLKLAEMEAVGKLKQSLHRISTVCIRWQGVKTCWSYTAAFIGITAKNVASFMMQNM